MTTKQNSKFQIFLAVMILSAPCLAAKKDLVPGFVPGKYELIEGENRLCGDGDFYLKDKELIWLGPHYSFRLSPGTRVNKAGLPTDGKDCSYRTETTVDSKGNETTFTEVDTYICEGKERRTITNKATVNKRKIAFTQSHQGDPKFYAGGMPHSCVWQRVK